MTVWEANQFACWNCLVRLWSYFILLLHIKSPKLIFLPPPFRLPIFKCSEHLLSAEYERLRPCLVSVWRQLNGANILLINSFVDAKAADFVRHRHCLQAVLSTIHLLLILLLREGAEIWKCSEANVFTWNFAYLEWMTAFNTSCFTNEYWNFGKSLEFNFWKSSFNRIN